MRAVILQPGYMPWLGFFDLMHQSDVFVYHTDVQYDKQSWRNRNRIKMRNGWCWLSVPVLIKGHSADIIREIRIDNSSDWGQKHWFQLRENYRAAPFFCDHAPFFQTTLSKRWEFLIDLDLCIADYMMSAMGLKRRIVFSHDLDLGGSNKTERLILICAAVGAEQYLNGPAGKAYIEEDLFRRAGIQLQWHDYPHPMYNQLHGPFLPYMSAVDLLFNHGLDSLEILTRQKTVVGYQSPAASY